ncbi:pimeloyl-ACP methyl ester carboxylesterase [Diaminobutyricimonas aerilata]|uniref:Pimeloyl-ACP methyl ester carboxylesterase n=1 Tax=Diaminobutyricimonas aerilata TaxID=1162967 RepID=A0A2M9CF47_9MICO|nr:alpha/beta fold hydrolase [Diaminobutyricimonas aerilata]PJJ70482.1 pimeloyl-ACP methyl ester carboxylesterase [Diaminobutyricimonas aerilata]
MGSSTITVVLVHGATSDTSNWDAVIERLARDGVRAVAAASRMHGLSDDGAHVADLVRRVDGPVVLVGHSYGGMVITQAATDAGDVEALVYVAAIAPDTGESWAELVALPPEGTVGAIPEHVLRDPLPTTTPGWRTLPSWFVYGDADRILPPSAVAFTAERAGARGTTLVEGASHALHVSRPDVVTRTIVAAIAG